MDWLTVGAFGCRDSGIECWSNGNPWGREGPSHPGVPDPEMELRRVWLGGGRIVAGLSGGEGFPVQRNCESYRRPTTYPQQLSSDATR